MAKFSYTRKLSGIISIVSMMAGSLAGPGTAFASAISVDQNALEKCRTEVDRFDRLSCFDKLFETPTDIVVEQEEPLWEKKIPSAKAPYGRLEALVRKIETSRIKGDDTWQFRYRTTGQAKLQTLDEMMVELAKPTSQNKEASVKNETGIMPEKAVATLVAHSDDTKLEPGIANIYLTMPEILSPDSPSEAGQAILFLTCEEDITTAGIILPQAVDRTKIPTQIRRDGNIAEKDIWQTSESYRVLISARGLVSISHICKWLQTKRTQISLPLEGKQRAFVFEMSNLRQMIGPLRKACRW
jgi:type VI secretion system protein VasI